MGVQCVLSFEVLSNSWKHCVGSASNI